jgi:hypothetical protein
MMGADGGVGRREGEGRACLSGKDHYLVSIVSQTLDESLDGRMRSFCYRHYYEERSQSHGRIYLLFKSKNLSALTFALLGTGHLDLHL